MRKEKSIFTHGTKESSSLALISKESSRDSEMVDVQSSVSTRASELLCMYFWLSPMTPQKNVDRHHHLLIFL